MPRDRCSASPPPVKTRSPFLATIVAVPVSWHIGSTKPAATSALRSSASTTPRSFSEASGSSSTAASCARWPGRYRNATSRNASRATRRSASGATFRTSWPSNVATETWSDATLRYGVSSFASGKGST